MVETHCWLSTTATGYLDLHMSSPHVIEGEGVEEQCYWEGVAHLEHAAFHPRVRAPRAPKAKRRFIAGFLTLCPHCTARCRIGCSNPGRVVARGAAQCGSWLAVKPCWATHVRLALCLQKLAMQCLPLAFQWIKVVLAVQSAVCCSPLFSARFLLLGAGRPCVETCKLFP